MQIRHTPLSGGYCGEVPPLPIPNREVKLTCADGTAMQCGRVGSRLLSISEASDFERFLRLFCFSHRFHRCSQIFPKSLHERYRKSENILSINDLEDCVRKEVSGSAFIPCIIQKKQKQLIKLMLLLLFPSVRK